MKWSLLVALVSIGLVAGNGAWKENYEYKYKLVQKNIYTNGELPGNVGSVLLSIRPQSENVWIGRITETAVAKLGDRDSENDSPATSADATFEKNVLELVPLNKLFKVYLRNGAIDTLSVDRTMTKKQINIVKFIVSRFQVDTKAQYLIRDSNDNDRTDMNTNNAYFMTMEPTVIGVCKTSYDIDRLQEYLAVAYAEYDKVPSLSKYADDEDVIQIKKKKNYIRDCNNEEAVNNADQNNDQHVGDIEERIIISGSLDKYTIHSSETTIKSEQVDSYLYLTLESMERVNEDSNYNPSPRFGNMQNVGNLVKENVDMWRD